MKIMKFKKEDVEGVTLTGENSEGFKKYLDFFEEQHSVTICDDDGVIGFVGLVVKDDLATVWLMPTDKLNSKKMDFVRSVKWFLDRIGHTFGISKVTTDCNGSKKIIRWLTYLGFKPVDGGAVYERCV